MGLLIVFRPRQAAGGEVVTPTTASLVLTGFAPTVTASDHKRVVPATGTLVLTTFAPSVVISDAETVTPPNATLVLTTFAPSVVVGGDQTVTPEPASLILTTFAPTVTATEDVILPPVGVSIRRGGLPRVRPAPRPVTATPRPARLRVIGHRPAIIQTFAPTVRVSDDELALLLLLEAA
jgi:hypothetical protein